MLIDEIKKKCPPSKICENSVDFITLENVDDIPKERLFIWYQNKKTFCADIISLKNYIDIGKSINPWTIDFATGIEFSKNREKYLKTWDLTQQKGLIDKIYSKYNSLSIDTINEPKIISIRFEIEKIADFTDQYITHIINKVEILDSRLYLYIMSDILHNCCQYFTLNNNQTISVLFNSLLIDNDILKIQLSYTMSNICNLEYMYKVMNSIYSNDDIYSKGPLSYFIIIFDEVLKSYNQ